MARGKPTKKKVPAAEPPEPEDVSAEESEHSDAEKTPKKAQRRKTKKSPTKKKSKRPNKSPEEDRSDSVDEPDDDVPMLDRLLKGSDATLVSEFLERYRKNPQKSVVDLLNMVISACGCPERIDVESLESGDVDSVLKNLITPAWTKKEAEERDNQECLVESRKHRKFRERFLGMWDAMVGREGRDEGILWDEFFLPVVTSWLTALSNSSARAFRRTATMAALQIARSLVGVALGIGEEMEKTERQRSRTSASPSKRRAKKRMEEQEKDAGERLKVVEDAFEEVHTGVVIVRYRDAVAEIRAECVQALAEFVAQWPAHLLKDSYVKYVAWSLYDRDASVRLASLRGLLAIYASVPPKEAEKDEEEEEEQEDEELAEERRTLERLTERFKSRVMEMALDKDSEVSSEALTLCQKLALAMHSLEEEDLKKVYSLIGDDEPALRRAVGQFVQQVAFTGTDEGDGQISSEAKIQAIIELALKYSNLPKMPCYVVDALWDFCPVLREWRAMTSLLLRETDGGASQSQSQDASVHLGEEELALLAGILSSACRRAAGLPIVAASQSSIGRQQPQPQKVSAKETERRKQVRDEMTAELARSLPRLIERYRDNDDVVAELCSVVPALCVPIYAAVRLEKHMTSLLQQLTQIFAQHSSETVLRPCAVALCHLASYDEPHKQTPEVESAVGALVEGICSAMQSDKSEEVTLSGIRRLLRLAEQLDITTHADLWKLAVPRINSWLAGASGTATEAAIVCAACGLLLADLLWKLAQVDVKQGPTPAQTSAIVTARDRFVNDMQNLLAVADSSPRDVGDTAFLSLVDALVLFSPSLSKTALKPLALTLTADTLTSLSKFFASNVLKRQPGPNPSDEKIPADEAVENEKKKTESSDEEEDEIARVIRLAAAYGKAACCGVLPVDQAASVLLLYHSSSEEDDKGWSEAAREHLSQRLDDMAKAMLRKIRDADRRNEWEAVALALQQCFEACCAPKSATEDDKPADDDQDKEKEKDDEEEGDKDKEGKEKEAAEKAQESDSDEESAAGKENKETTKDAKEAAVPERFAELCKWLAMSYGPQPTGELRQSMLQVVEECVLWSLESAEVSHKRIGILGTGGLVAFAHKLTAGESRQLVGILGQRADKAGVADEAESANEPFLGFKRVVESQAKGEARGKTTTGRKKAATTTGGTSGGRRGGRGRRKPSVRKLDLEEAEVTKGEGQEEPAAEKEPGPMEDIEEAEEEPPKKRETPKRKAAMSPKKKITSDDVDDADADEEAWTTKGSAKKKRRQGTKSPKAKSQSQSPATRKTPSKKASEPEEPEEEEEGKKKTPSKKTSEPEDSDDDMDEEQLRKELAKDLEEATQSIADDSPTTEQNKRTSEEGDGAPKAKKKKKTKKGAN